VSQMRDDRKRARHRSALLIVSLCLLSACGQGSPADTSGSSTLDDEGAIQDSTAHSVPPSTTPVDTAVSALIYQTDDLGVTPMPEEEMMDFLVRCLEANGIPARRIGEGAQFGHGNWSQAQMQAATKVSDACIKLADEAGISGHLDMSDPADRERIYDDYIEVTECLRANGFTPADPPSMDSFLETGRLWDPYAGMSFDEGMEGDEVCPSNHFAFVRLSDYGEWNGTSG